MSLHHTPSKVLVAKAADLVEQVLATESEATGKTLLAELQILLNGAVDYSQENSTGPTGLILGHQGAADCLLSYHRTIAYWRALIDAVENFPSDQTVQVVYPGPGPMASLVLPVWLAKKWPNIQITFVEYNEVTASKLQVLLERLEVAGRVKLENADASRYVPDDKIDVLVMECLTFGLRDEGQFAISTHLSQFLSPDGILIPERIRLDLHYGLLPKEFEEVASGKAVQEFSDVTRIWSEHLMSLDKYQKTHPDSGKESILLGRYRLPAKDKAGNHLFISTQITTLNQYVIPEFACGLTIPFSVGTSAGPDNTQDFEAYYHYGQQPGIQLVGINSVS